MSANSVSISRMSAMGLVLCLLRLNSEKVNMLEFAEGASPVSSPVTVLRRSVSNSSRRNALNGVA